LYVAHPAPILGTGYTRGKAFAPLRPGIMAEKTKLARIAEAAKAKRSLPARGDRGLGTGD